MLGPRAGLGFGMWKHGGQKGVQGREQRLEKKIL